MSELNFTIVSYLFLPFPFSYFAHGFFNLFFLIHCNSHLKTLTWLLLYYHHKWHSSECLGLYDNSWIEGVMCCKVNFKASLGLGTLGSPNDTRIDEPEKQSVRVYGGGGEIQRKKKKSHF